MVSGNDFRDAQPSVDENGRPDVTFILTATPGDRFYKFTSANIGKPLAVVLDNTVREVGATSSRRFAIRAESPAASGKEKAQTCR